MKTETNLHHLLVVDLFCGAGGTSTGIHLSTYKNRYPAKVIACVNHDKNAIASHAANHPGTLHFQEDIRTLDLTPIVMQLMMEKKKNPGSLLVLWASLECTNFSKAKGGLARDPDSRTLAEHLFRYIDILNPDYIYIENVREFMSWGDLDEKGKPLSRDKGRKYEAWKKKVMSYGYDFDYRILNAANYGAYTTRERFFGIFAGKGLPIVFPTPTHIKDPEKNLFGEMERWKPVKEVLQLEEIGASIFSRKKPLAEKTLERIYAGLIKFVAGGKENFIIKWNSMNRKGNYQAPSIDEPCPVVATQNRLGLASVQWLSKQYSGHPDSKNHSIDEPAGTITTIDHHAFITAYYGNGHNHSLENPSPTLTTKDRLALVNYSYLINYYSAGGQLSSLGSPCPAIMTKPKQSLVSCQFILNPQYCSTGGCIDKPCFTLIARMDKRPPYLVSAVREGELPPFIKWNGNEYIYEIYETDSPAMKKIKEFMALYGLADIYMRMLHIDELKVIMGFPEDYKLIGTQAEQKKYIGNAVEVNMCKALFDALLQKLYEVKLLIA